MYVSPDFKTKKALREGLTRGVVITIFQPGPFGGNEPTNAVVSIEGPHFPEPHSWYGRVKVENGQVVKVIQ